MLPGQREIGIVMVKGGIIPGGGLVTRTALCAKCPGMFIVFGMAGKTILRRFRGDGGCVAIFAGDLNMTAFKFERRQVVVKSGGRPGIHQVTFRAVRTEAALVWFIVPMTGITVSGRGLQIQQRTRTGMAGVTIQLHMRSRQLKRDLTVIKMFVIGINSIVAGETIIAPVQHMYLCEYQVGVSMAIDAGR